MALRITVICEPDVGLQFWYLIASFLQFKIDWEEIKCKITGTGIYIRIRHSAHQGGGQPSFKGPELKPWSESSQLAGVSTPGPPRLLDVQLRVC